MVISNAAPSSSASIDESKETASAKSNKFGRQQIVATNSSNETPPIRKGNASSGAIASRSLNTSAAALNNLASCLGDLGQRDAALAVAEEVAQLYRELAIARPDASRPYLAASLGNLGLRLRDLGRPEHIAQVAKDIAGKRILLN